MEVNWPLRRALAAASLRRRTQRIMQNSNPTPTPLQPSSQSSTAPPTVPLQATIQGPSSNPVPTWQSLQRNRPYYPAPPPPPPVQPGTYYYTTPPPPAPLQLNGPYYPVPPPPPPVQLPACPECARIYANYIFLQLPIPVPVECRCPKCRLPPIHHAEPKAVRYGPREHEIVPLSPANKETERRNGSSEAEAVAPATGRRLARVAALDGIPAAVEHREAEEPRRRMPLPRGLNLMQSLEVVGGVEEGRVWRAVDGPDGGVGELARGELKRGDGYFGNGKGKI